MFLLLCMVANIHINVFYKVGCLFQISFVIIKFFNLFRKDHDHAMTKSSRGIVQHQDHTITLPSCGTVQVNDHDHASTLPSRAIVPGERIIPVFHPGFHTRQLKGGCAIGQGLFYVKKKRAPTEVHTSIKLMAITEKMACMKGWGQTLLGRSG